MERHKPEQRCLRELFRIYVLAVSMLFVAARLEINPSPEIIHNNTSMMIGDWSEAYIYCWEGEERDQDRLVLWQKKNRTVGSFVQGSRVFVVGCSSSIPHCILTFMDFRSDLVDWYGCLSQQSGTPTVSSWVHVQEAPSSRHVVDVGCCRPWAKTGKAAACLANNSTGCPAVY
ncbi:hypothetical protein E2C01_047242 [Portunus trituberculatus]|uniref:Uncharacterized protein n=1 Tax=Portunus trituberculatus TaxID=210409 RepID=A0A5B7G809_PORTR|nr:hypothetical protein [Portunus trituberculatus]